MNTITIIDRGSRWEGSSTSDEVLESLIDNVIDEFIEESGVSEIKNSIWDNENCLIKWAEDFINEVYEGINKPIIVSAGKKRSRPAERVMDSVASNTRSAKRKRSASVAGNTRAAKKRNM